MKVALGSILGFFADRLFFRDIKRHIRQKEAIEDLEIILKLARRKRKPVEEDMAKLSDFMNKDVWFSDIPKTDLRKIAKRAEESLHSVRIHGYQKARKLYENRGKSEEEDEFPLSEKISAVLGIAFFIFILISALK